LDQRKWVLHVQAKFAYGKVKDSIYGGKHAAHR
jgi:hypothetical protein